MFTKWNTSEDTTRIFQTYCEVLPESIQRNITETNYATYQIRKRVKTGFRFFCSKSLELIKNQVRSYIEENLESPEISKKITALYFFKETLEDNHWLVQKYEILQ